MIVNMVGRSMAEAEAIIRQHELLLNGPPKSAQLCRCSGPSTPSGECDVDAAIRIGRAAHERQAQQRDPTDPPPAPAPQPQPQPQPAAPTTSTTTPPVQVYGHRTVRSFEAVPGGAPGVFRQRA